MSQNGLSEKSLTALVELVFREMHVHSDSEVSISFVDETEMERLHLEWMDLPGATDVMSFPMDELTPGSPAQPAGPGVLGDVVVCLPVAAEQADAAGHSLASEVAMLVTHSLLHLLGFDHHTPLEEAEMFKLQRSLLESFAA
ncbi:rRNA maturation RNase YbeY [Canibacter zhoujuaniae]|uniref:rRNA maturation RNase YbeY n=1 Tax=Canibacter zhoujuaniae TaxID=2708343 RepID=UPI002443D16A|nr:rRNA maturation RNase YbeY [Canibacter zhoujuaniae]